MGQINYTNILLLIAKKLFHNEILCGIIIIAKRKKGVTMEQKSWKELRTERGISVSFVAKTLNRTPQTIRNKEKGLSEFSWIEANKLCHLYGVELNEVKA